MKRGKNLSSDIIHLHKKKRFRSFFFYKRDPKIMTLLLLRWLVYNSDVDIRGSPRSKRKGFFFFPFFPERWRINKVFAGEFLIHMLFGGCSAPSFPFHRVSPFIRQSSYIPTSSSIEGFFFLLPAVANPQHSTAPAGSSHLSV